MTHETPVCRSWALASFLVIALTIVASPSANAQGTTAFVNVNVIPMANESVLVGYTVVVIGDEITALRHPLPPDCGNQPTSMSFLMSIW